MIVTQLFTQKYFADVVHGGAAAERDWLRIALGADRRAVVRMVMREAGLLLAGGVVVGTALAVAAARTAATLLFGLRPCDPATLAIAAVGLGTVAMLASYLPALRAAAGTNRSAARGVTRAHALSVVSGFSRTVVR